MLNLTRVKQQCKIEDDHTADDELLSMYLVAAKQAVANYVNRVIYWEVSEKPSEPEDIPETAIDVVEALELAALLLISQYYENRSAASETAIKQMPLGFKHLCDPYRVINL